MVLAVNQIAINEWTLCLQSNQLLRADLSVQLENRQSQLLEYLARRAGSVVSKAELLQQVWGNRVVSEDALYVCVANLRRVLGDDTKSPAYIKTINGQGYCLVAKVEDIVSRDKDTDVEVGKPSAVDRPKQSALLILSVLFAVSLSVGGIVWHQYDDAVELKDLPLAVADDYRQARYYMTPQIARYDEGLALLKSVVEAEPRFAGAYADLGESQYFALLSRDERGSRAEADRLINKALELDPDNERAHFTSAMMAFILDWDFERAQQHFLQARNLSAAELWYAQFLVAIGEFELAQQHIRHYVAENPQQYAMISVAWVYAMARDYEKAEAVISPLSEVSPDDFYYRVSRQFIHQLSGRELEATKDLFWLMSHAGYEQEQVDRLRIEAKDKGIKSIYRWLAFSDKQHLNIGQYKAPFSQARYALAAGDHFKALQWLEEAVVMHQEEVLWIMADPAFDALRDYPKFQQLVETIGLDQFNYEVLAQ